MIEVKSISIIRLEGRSDLCDIEHKFDNYEKAHKWVLSQQFSLPDMGYDKFKFKVVWKDESEYEGRMDLHGRDNEFYKEGETHVGDHIKSYCQWMINNPDKCHVNEIEMAENFVNNYSL